jgi:hypothetical protein
MVFILSIDVGIKNLAMCMIDGDSKVIQHWDVSGVPPESEDGLFKSMCFHLDAKPWVLTAGTILIEKQPGQNKKMKSVENFLHAYFIIKCPNAETIIYDARHKIPDVAGRGRARYVQRKNASIERCASFIEGDENKHWIPTFKASKKKDDLADTVMQALSFINRIEPATTTKKKTTNTNKITPRKPTENQKTTKYSKSNLAWFVKTKSRADLEKDKRFMKDVLRYYRSLDDLFKELE